MPSAYPKLPFVEKTSPPFNLTLDTLLPVCLTWLNNFEFFQLKKYLITENDDNNVSTFEKRRHQQSRKSHCRGSWSPPTKEAPLSSWGVGWNHTALSFFQRKQGEAQLLINNRLYWRLDSRNFSPTFLVPKMSSFEFNLQDFQDTRSFFHKKEISKKWNYNGQKFSLLADISAQGVGGGGRTSTRGCTQGLYPSPKNSDEK